MRIIRPPKLNIGDTVSVISPSQPVTNQRHYRRSINVLSKLGLKVKLGKNALRTRGFAAGTLENRLEDFHTAFADSEIKAIFTSSGGFSSLDLLPHINYELIKNNPKIFCGFSDISTLLNVIFKKTGLITFYNFPIERFHKRADAFTLKSFSDLFLAENPALEFPVKSRWKVLQRGRAKGRLIGGNLLTFTNGLGFKDLFPDPRQDRSRYILFFEEHNADLEEVNNTLRRLGLYGALERMAGIIIGKITSPSSVVAPPSGIVPVMGSEFRHVNMPKNLTLYNLLTQIFEEFNVKAPIAANLDFGYTKNHFTVPVGALAFMNLDKTNPTIKLVYSPFSAGQSKPPSLQGV